MSSCLGKYSSIQPSFCQKRNCALFSWVNNVELFSIGLLPGYLHCSHQKHNTLIQGKTDKRTSHYYNTLNKTLMEAGEYQQLNATNGKEPTMCLSIHLFSFPYCANTMTISIRSQYLASPWLPFFSLGSKASIVHWVHSVSRKIYNLGMPSKVSGWGHWWNSLSYPGL